MREIEFKEEIDLMEMLRMIRERSVNFIGRENEMLYL